MVNGLTLLTTSYMEAHFYVPSIPFNNNDDKIVYARDCSFCTGVLVYIMYSEHILYSIRLLCSVC